MSIFSKIREAIWGTSTAHAAPAPAGPAPTTGKAGLEAAAGSAMAAPAKAPAESAKPAAGAATASAPAAGAAPAVDVAAVLTKLAAEKKEDLDWRRSIVDLMKLLNLDSSLAARKELAQEMKYAGDMNDSASMNVWLHKQVMQKLAEHGGKVPEELKG